VRRAALQTGRFAAATLLPADQNALRQNSVHYEYRPYSGKGHAIVFDDTIVRRPSAAFRSSISGARLWLPREARILSVMRTLWH